MASLVLSGDTSGSITVAAPAVAGSTTQTLVNVSGTLAPIVSGTAVTASGTSVDFTGIPSWVKRITVMLAGVSTNGSSSLLVQIGSGSFTVTGYSGQCNAVGSLTAMSTGFMVNSNMTAANLHSGNVSIATLGSNIWSESGLVLNQGASNNGCFSGGFLTLSGTLDRVRITTVNGTDTFDAGSINILYE